MSVCIYNYSALVGLVVYLHSFPIHGHTHTHTHPPQHHSIRHTLLGFEIQLGRPNNSRMHVTYWIHPDMNCNRFHIHCVCLWVPYHFSPLPHSLFLTIPSLPLSPPLRTCLTLCLMCMHVRFVVIEGVLFSR